MVLHLNPPEGDYERDCVIYLRKSKGKAGIARQRRDSEAVARRKKWRIVAEFEDADSTAFTKPGHEQARRDDYQAMLTMLRNDPREQPLGVIGWHADRVHRSTDEVGVFIAICSQGAGHPVETHCSGGYDLTTATGRKRLKQDALDAESEVDHMVERIVPQKAEAYRAGRWAGGRVPFGWKLVRLDPEDETRTLVVHPEQAAAVAWGCDRIIRRASRNSIAREWNKRGLRQGGGQLWDGTAVTRVLVRPRNAGLMVHRGQIIETELPGGKAEWEPLVSEEVWRAVVSVVGDTGRTPAYGPPRKWWGSGLFLCGVCGGVLYGGSRGKYRNGQHPYVYRCQTALGSHVVRNAKNLDTFVEEVLLERLGRDDLKALLAEDTPPDVDGMKLRLTVEQGELADWRRLAKAGKVSAVAFAATEPEVMARIDAIKQEIAAAVRSPILGELLAAPDIPAFWSEHADDLEWKRAALASLVTVVVHPARKGRPPGWKAGTSYFDTDTIFFDWERRSWAESPYRWHGPASR